MYKTKNSPKSFHRCEPGPLVWQELETWYQSELGQLLAEQEQQQLHSVLSDLFGYHLLHIGYPGEASLLSSSRVSHQVRMHINPSQQAFAQSDKQFYAEPHALPFLPDSLDVVVLSHILEFSSNPHQVLREVEHTLIPEGHVVLTGFNPLSIWSLWRLLFGRHRKLPWCGHFISVTRIKDWLALLGFDMVKTRYYFYRPPLQYRGTMKKLRIVERIGSKLWPILGGGYVVVAKKRVQTLTPIRPRWKSRRQIVATGLVEPMTPHTHRRGKQ